MRDRLIYPTWGSWSSDREWFHLYRAPGDVTLKAQMSIGPANGSTGVRVVNSRTVIIVKFDAGADLAATP